MTASTFVIYIPCEEEDEEVDESGDEADRLQFKDELTRKHRGDECKPKNAERSTTTSTGRQELRASSGVPCDQSEADREFSERARLLQDNTATVTVKILPNAATKGSDCEAARLTSNNESLPRLSKQARFDVTPASSSNLGADGACAEALSRRPSVHTGLAKAADLADLPEVTTEILTLRRVS